MLTIFLRSGKWYISAVEKSIAEIGKEQLKKLKEKKEPPILDYRQFYDFADVSNTIAYKICVKAVCRNAGGFYAYLYEQKTKTAYHYDITPSSMILFNSHHTFYNKCRGCLKSNTSSDGDTYNRYARYKSNTGDCTMHYKC